MMKHLVVIAGPTAIGKTAAGIVLAAHYQTEIISADSRQFFREMTIGTAKPSEQELAAVKHHFINSHSIHELVSVGDFERQGLDLLTGLFREHDVVVMVGGSGLYIKAICEGFDDLPTAEPEIREQLNAQLAQHGIGYLQERLQAVDPVYFAQVDQHNPQRLIRALEVFESTGQPYSTYRKGSGKQRPFNIIKIGLDMPRQQLYNRINQRVDMMIAQGLVDEVKGLLPYRHLNALNTVGYSEVFDYLDGHTDLNKAIEMIKQNTRRFAKRQLTWFRKDTGVQWFEPGDLQGMIAYINAKLAGQSNS